MKSKPLNQITEIQFSNDYLVHFMAPALR